MSYIDSLFSAHTLHKRIVQFCFLVPTVTAISSCTSYQRAFPPAELHQSARQKPQQKPRPVNEKRVEPLTSPEGFEQDGLASAYGKEFHGRKTSNGETFDMNAMTAAHKTLPMGVYVRVRHKRSGNEVVVRINDRGPFVKDRIIDLSDASAARLGIIKEGLAPVRITALGYRADGIGGTNSYRPATSYDSGAFSVQVGAFTIKTNADRYAAQLKREFGAVNIQEALVGGTKYYRVRVGQYTSLRIAQASQEQYERKGLTDCFIVAVD